jgi:methyl-accepting chemotaxis protein
MHNLRIGIRLFLLIAALLVMLLIVGLTGFAGLTQANNALTGIESSLETESAAEDLAELISIDLYGLATNLNFGSVAWEQGAKKLTELKAEFQKRWEDFENAVTENDKKEIEASKNLLNGFVVELENLIVARDRNKLNFFVANDLTGMVDLVGDKLLEPYRERFGEQLKTTFARSKATSQNFRTIMLVIAVLGILFSALLGSVIYNSIANPVEKIANTVKKVSAGDFGARTGLAGGDELAELGQGFDQLLDERLTNLVKAEQENDSLNVSVISLLQAVSQLSQRDLTVKVPVNEDITGPMADALNLLTTETAKVLAEVTHVSEEVATASNMVKAQSDTVIAVANDERQEVERATSELMAAAEDMSRIAELAKSCNQTAEGAIESTRKALDTVVSTVDGITSTRDTIRETEKRIKRLGERSQEITGVVGLINTIAERTHILALNASMHAASAGEAGRGFAVVADEVQRLAENAREATAQISTLVSSIQVETADTVNAMNLAISQVVEGSRMAEQAGEQMKRTQQTTADLVASVQQIAVRSQDQARASSALLERAKQIQNSTVLTGQRLMEQNEYTGNLVEYAKSLVNSVRVFKLPATENA